MSRLRAGLLPRVAAFHLRLGGCGGCGDMVDMLLRGAGAGRLGVAECGTPRHAGLLVVTGAWNRGQARAATEVVGQAPGSVRVLVVGDCALGGGLLLEASREPESVREHVSADLEVAGCPIEAEEFMEAIRRAAR